MKKQKGIIILILIIALSFTNVKALSCNSTDNATLNKKAYRIKVDYEVINDSKINKIKIDGKETSYLVPTYKFMISLYNLDSSDIYIEISNSENKEVDIVGTDDTENGIYSFTDYDFNSTKEYEFSVMSAMGSCIGEKVKTIKLIKPKYNVFSEYDYCKNSKMYFCQKFITSDLPFIDEQGFFKAINVSNKNDRKEEFNLIKNIKSNSKIIIIAFVITAFISMIIIVIHKLRSRGDVI